LRRARRRLDRRARRRHREARPDGRDVFGSRPQPAAAPEMRLRRPGPAQSRKGLSDPAPLRRARPRARARWQAGFSRYSAVLGGKPEFPEARMADIAMGATANVEG